MKLDRNRIIKIIRNHKGELIQKYSLKSIALFGSYATEKQQSESDIDLLIDFTKPIGMEIVDLAMDLEELLKAKVDLVTFNAVKNRLLKKIENELIYV